MIRIAFRAIDSFVLAIAWVSSYWTRHRFPQIGHKGLPPFSTYMSILPLVLLLWGAVFAVLGVYQSGWMRGRLDEAKLVSRAHVTALALFLSLAFLFKEYDYSRLVLFLFGTYGAVLLVAVHVTVLTALRLLRGRGFDVHRVLIVGGGATIRTLVERFAAYPELGMGVVGLVTRDGEPPDWSADVPVLGRFPDVAQIVESQKPHDVLLALTDSEQSEQAWLVRQLRNATTNVVVVPQVQELVALGCGVERVEGVAVIRLNDSPIGAWQSFAKRSIDVVLSAFGLVILAPLLLLIGLAVKFTSPGPVLYSQERMGLDGRTFRMLKFRSMRVDAEGSGVGWTAKRDDRRTPLGIVLRQTSLDELPQLWNVLVGHMSLVGPRPERPVYVKKFQEEIPDYMLRHKVKAGITGWAQVNGWRGDTSLTERIACDLYYIRNWSLDLDLKILLLTLWKGFVNKNAY
jgi:Undecaprenyl-phosphate glucose phosphotransferase